MGAEPPRTFRTVQLIGIDRLRFGIFTFARSEAIQTYGRIGEDICRPRSSHRPVDGPTVRVDLLVSSGYLPMFAFPYRQ